VRRIFDIICIILFLSGSAYGQLLIQEYNSRLEKPIPQYKIEINLDIENRIYSGKERIVFKYPLSKDKDVILRLFANSGGGSERNLDIKSIMLDGKTAEFFFVDDTTVSIRGDFVSKKSYTIEIEFSATLPEITQESTDIFLSTLKQLLGQGSSSVTENNYGIFGCSANICNIASVVPALAKVNNDDWSTSRMTGMGDYQRGDFADYEIDVVHDDSVLVVSNGVIKKRESLKEGKVRSRFFADSVNDIILEASCNFNYVRREINGVLYISYYVNDRDKRLAELSIDVASEAIGFFSRYYAKYPYSEFKIVSAPMTGGAGGVEFPALITIGDFLYDEIDGDEQRTGEFISYDLLSQMFEFVIVHEVAHQWFSTLIPSDSRTEPYLDEGLASFSAYLYFINKYGEVEAKKFLDNQIRLNYIMMRLLGYKDMPINTPIENYENMFQYAGIIYGKAPLFFVKLYELIGKERFRFIVSQWVKERAFKDTRLISLINTLKANEPAKASSIESLYKRWFEGRYGDEDIGKGSLKDLLKFLNNGKDLDIDFNLDRLKKFLEDTFDMFREYR